MLVVLTHHRQTQSIARFCWFYLLDVSGVYTLHCISLQLSVHGNSSLFSLSPPTLDKTDSPCPTNRWNPFPQSSNLVMSTCYPPTEILTMLEPSGIGPTAVPSLRGLQSPAHSPFQPTGCPSVLPISRIPSRHTAFALAALPSAFRPLFGYLIPTHSSDFKTYFPPHAHLLLILR